MNCCSIMNRITDWDRQREPGNTQACSFPKGQADGARCCYPLQKDITLIYIHTGYSNKNGAVLNVNKKSISRLT
jgi:hypothetical protein